MSNENIKKENISQSMHESFQVSQKAIIYDSENDKFLLVKSTDRVEPEDMEYLGYWELVGGKIGIAENAPDALWREITEETGNEECEILGVVDAQLLRWSEKKAYSVGYLVTWAGEEITLSPEHSEYRWVSPQEVEEGTEYKPWLKQYIHSAVKYLKTREYLNDLKRVQADFENYKKRQAAESKEFSAHLAKSIVADLIPVLDNLHAASEHVPADLEESPWVKGITYIEKQFEDALKNYGVEPIEVKPGDTFNPMEHEAVDQKTEEGKESEHRIEKVLQKGYKIGDRVIKAARVIVS